MKTQYTYFYNFKTPTGMKYYQIQKTIRTIQYQTNKERITRKKVASKMKEMNQMEDRLETKVDNYQSMTKYNFNIDVKYETSHD